MIKLLLTVLGLIVKIPGSKLSELYNLAVNIVQKNDDPNDKTSGWEKLKSTVLVLINNVPEKYTAIASAVVTIIINIALIVTRLKKG